MESVLASALVGTGHQTPVSDNAEPWDPAVPADRPERALLLRAGAWAVYRQAGRQPLAAPPAPEPAPAEIRPACSPQALRLLEELAGVSAHEPLYRDALRRLDACGLRLPHAMLLSVMDERTNAMRDLLRPVIGERGHWLAQFAPVWAWARKVRQVEVFDLAALTVLWEEGSPEERLAALKRVRKEDPALGRAWLAKGFSKEKAEYRTTLIMAIADTLVPADEDFLEACLGDRAAEVRAQAALLLSRLPGSALSARMRARVEAHVKYHKGLFKTTLTLERPEELPEDWARDGITAVADGASVRDNWMRSLIGYIPPDYWQAKFGGRPDQVVATILKFPETLPLLLGLADAVGNFNAREWAATIMVTLTRPDLASDRWYTQSSRPLLAMQSRIPPADLERLILEQFALGNQRLAFNWISAYREPWSERLITEYLGRLKQHLQAVSKLERYDSWTDPWNASLQYMGLRLPPEALPRVDALIPPATDPPPPYRPLLDSIDRAREHVVLRQRIQKEITP